MRYLGFSFFLGLGFRFRADFWGSFSRVALRSSLWFLFLGFRGFSVLGGPLKGCYEGSTKACGFLVKGHYRALV